MGRLFGAFLENSTGEAALPFDDSMVRSLLLEYPSHRIGASRILHADWTEWATRVPEESIHSIVTDPPYGVKEYDFDQLEKRGNGKGGIWRIPPSFDGNTRAPLPRFTALNARERSKLKESFVEWGRLMVRVLRPGGHAFIASNAFLSQLVFGALAEAGLEFRGELIRVVRTLRGRRSPKKRGKRFPRRYISSARLLRAMGLI